MSIHYVAQWSVHPEDIEACEQALAVITDHVESEHPGAHAVRVFRQSWGPQPRRGYTYLEEYASLEAMEAEPETPECKRVWAVLETLMIESTYICSVWNDLGQAHWFDRDDDEDDDEDEDDEAVVDDLDDEDTHH